MQTILRLQTTVNPIPHPKNTLPVFRNPIPHSKNALPVIRNRIAHPKNALPVFRNPFSQTLLPSLLARIPLTVLCLILVFTSCTSPERQAGQGSPLSDSLLSVIDSTMSGYVKKGELAGISTLVMQGDRVIQRGVYGYANLEEERMMREDALFRIYSMSKPVTAAALMILFDEGKFRLDDPVYTYIPEFEETKVWTDGQLTEQQEPFTIRHLLTHTAGFTYGWDLGSHVDSLYGVNDLEGGIWDSPDLESMMEKVARIPLKYQPGTRYEYSVSIDVAGYLVEVLSGLSFHEFLQARLFGPLEMDDTGFQVEEEDFDRLAVIYTGGGEEGSLEVAGELTREVMRDVTLFSGGGGMVSTLSDYARFGRMLLNGGELDGVRVLEESTVDLIMSDQLPEGVEYGEHNAYGLGGYVEPETGEYGWTGMASTLFAADPSRDLVILACAQYVPYMKYPFAYQFKEAVQEEVNGAISPES